MKRVLAALAALFLCVPATAEILVSNVNGYTLNAEGRLQRFTAMVLTDEGKVQRLLTARDKRTRRPKYGINGQGRTLLPGLIDAHGHVMGLGANATQLDLAGTTSLADLQERLRRYAVANPTPVWIVGRGWNQELWADKRFPTAADLDSVVRDRPVFLERVDGHAAVVNTAALRAGNVTGATPDPTGGRVEKAGGQPTGLLIDAAMPLVQDRIPPPLPAQRERALLAAQEQLLSHGITATADMGTGGEDWLVMRRVGDRGQLKLRILSYASGIEPLLAVAGGGPTPYLYGDRLRMVGVKLYADGALGSRGAWLKQPYADAAGQRGLRFLDDAKLQNLMSRAAMDGFQVAVHAIGDAANAQVLAGIEELAGTYTGDRRWRVEHAQIVDAPDIARFGRNGIIASMQPVHQTSDRTMAEVRLGAARLPGAYAWQSMLRAGSRLAFGSDYPVESPNPFHGLAAAVTREDAAGQPAGGWLATERVTMEQALDGFTRSAAHASFAEDRLGTLQPGRWADFILVDRDPFQVTPREMRDTRVIETYIGGRKAWTR